VPELAIDVHVADASLGATILLAVSFLAGLLHVSCGITMRRTLHFAAAAGAASAIGLLVAEARTVSAIFAADLAAGLVIGKLLEQAQRTSFRLSRRIDMLLAQEERRAYDGVKPLQDVEVGTLLSPDKLATSNCECAHGGAPGPSGQPSSLPAHESGAAGPSGLSPPVGHGLSTSSSNNGPGAGLHLAQSFPLFALDMDWPPPPPPVHTAAEASLALSMHAPIVGEVSLASSTLTPLDATEAKQLAHRSLQQQRSTAAALARECEASVWAVVRLMLIGWERDEGAAFFQLSEDAFYELIYHIIIDIVQDAHTIQWPGASWATMLQRVPRARSAVIMLRVDSCAVNMFAFRHRIHPRQAALRFGALLWEETLDAPAADDSTEPPPAPLPPAGLSLRRPTSPQSA